MAVGPNRLLGSILMRRNTSIFCVGLIVAAVAACIQAPEPPPPPAIPVMASTQLPSIANTRRISAAQPICTAGDENSFVNAISILNPTYNPNTALGQYQPPSNYVVAQFDPDKNAGITADLKQAFKNAPSWFQTRLCSLNGIYLNPAGCANGATYVDDKYQCNGATDAIMQGAWGFRSFQANASDKGSTYISIPARL